MVTRMPMKGASIDKVEIDPLRDSDASPAVVDYLQDIDRLQWKALTILGAPDYFMPMVLPDGGVSWNGSSYDLETTTRVFAIQVPPTIATADFVILAAGAGKFEITTDTDSTGSEIKYGNSASTKINNVQPYWSNGVFPTSAGAGSGRAIDVATSGRARWQTCIVTVKHTRYGEASTIVSVEQTDPGTIYGIGFRWVWEPVDITDSESV